MFSPDYPLQVYVLFLLFCPFFLFPFHYVSFLILAFWYGFTLDIHGSIKLAQRATLSVFSKKHFWRI